MESKFTSTRMVTVALAVLMASFAPAAYADKCSTETVAGDWVLTLTGTIVPGGVAVGAIARGTWDESGNITNGTEARNVGGGYADETVTGNWTVSPDCTGTLNANIYESGVLVRVSVVSITFDDDSAEFRGVQKSLTLPDGTNVPVVITLEGHRQRAASITTSDNAPGTPQSVAPSGAALLKEPSVIGFGSTASACYPLGHACGSANQCCSNMCGMHHYCCDKPLRSMYCTSSVQCCSGLCLNHRCSGS